MHKEDKGGVDFVQRLSHCMSPGKFLHLEWKDLAYHTRDPLRFSDSFQRRTAFQRRGAHSLITNRIRIA